MRLKYDKFNESMTDWPAIHKECERLGQAVIEVTKYSEDREISIQQMKYLHAVVFPTIAREMPCSLWTAELDCKRYAGREWLIKKIEDQHFVLSKTSLTVKQTNDWIDNIRDWAEQGSIFIPLPNRNWRQEKN